MNDQNYLIKIHYSLLAQLQWHHTEKFYIGKNVTINNLLNII